MKPQTVEDVLALPNMPLWDYLHFPDIPVIYFVVVGGDLAYIGIAASLHYRWRNHHRYSHLIHLGDPIIYWMEVENYSKRSARLVEEELVAALNPSVNNAPYLPCGAYPCHTCTHGMGQDFRSQWRAIKQRAADVPQG